jgi:argininosuccinate lyase
VVRGLKVDAKSCRAAFTPGVFATDAALCKVASGTPWRDAYHEVRDNLDMLSNEDCDNAVKRKTHEGTCLGIDRKLYSSRISSVESSAKKRLNRLEQLKKALLK